MKHSMTTSVLKGALALSILLGGLTQAAESAAAESPVNQSTASAADKKTNTTKKKSTKKKSNKKSTSARKTKKSAVKETCGIAKHSHTTRSLPRLPLFETNMVSLHCETTKPTGAKVLDYWVDTIAPFWSEVDPSGTLEDGGVVDTNSVAWRKFKLKFLVGGSVFNFSGEKTQCLRNKVDARGVVKRDQECTIY